MPDEPSLPRSRRDREVMSGRTVLIAIGVLVVVVSGTLILVSGVLTRAH